MRNPKNLRVCEKGHEYYKSSDCPVCPICANEDKPENFLGELAAPARRALQNAGIISINDLSRCSEKEILALHGMGRSSIPLLKEALKSKGLTFKE